MNAPVELNQSLVKSWLPARPEDGHKGTFGKVDIIAGSEGYTGAPVLAARAAVRGGTGLVFLQIPRCVYPIVAVKCDEAMPSPLPDQGGKVSGEALPLILERAKGCDAILIGPGLGRSGESDRLVRTLTEQLEPPLVLDADGLNALDGHITILRGRSGPTVLTPHDGEFARLTGHWPGENRQAEALALAEQTGAVVVLKGHRTVIAEPGGSLCVNTTGNAGMAKGGSGDVLAGLTVSLMAQGMDAFRAAAAAVWIHGSAGNLCRDEMGERAMAPSDLISHFGAVLKPLEEQEKCKCT
ncbi:MAG: NAD(P)H-hydrate dehydratase [Clostridiales bacterium]|nr:NAD(P)H-hydrate dehydratase [Clostridiales bacterium]